MMTSAVRILERCERDGDCLIWQGATQSSGYGSVGSGVKGKTLLAHRVVFTEMVGPIEEGMTVDHLCFNKLCQNVFHMELVTVGENSRRAIARKQFCKQGHPLSGDNVFMQTRATGRVHRVCRTCRNEQGRRHRERAKMRAAA